MDLIAITVGASVPIALWCAKEVFVPDILDRLSFERTSRHEREAESRRYEREDAPVRWRIKALILEELEALSKVMVRGAYSTEEWQRLHDAVAALVDSNEAARALGDAYIPFKMALRYDQFSINFQRRQDEEHRSRPEQANIPHVHGHVLREGTAMRDQNVTSTIMRWCDVLQMIKPDVELERLSERAFEWNQVALSTFSER